MFGISKWRVFNKIQGSPFINSNLRMKLLKKAGMKLSESSLIEEDVFLGSKKLIMGDNTYINVGCFLDGSEEIILEDYARIGPFAKILTGSHDYRHSVIRRIPGDPVVAKKVVIEKGVWIGIGAMILPGITIKKGCIVAAGAVVTKDTQPNGLYAGNPAKRIKDLPTTDNLD